MTASDRRVQVWRGPLLGLHGREVLDIPAHDPPQVLPPPINQRREVHGIPRGSPIVVPVRINRGPVVAHPPVRVAGQRDEHRGSEPTSELAADRGLADAPGRQVGCVLASLGGPFRRPPGGQVGGGQPTPDTELPKFFVGLVNGFAQLVRVAGLAGIDGLSGTTPRGRPARRAALSARRLARRARRPVRSSRCQPSRHWAIRSARAFRAHGPHTDSTVDPQGIGTYRSSPVSGRRLPW